MGAIVYVSSLREILMPRGNAAEIVFTIKGRESAKPESMDLRAIEIDGEGVALVESESGEPLAARLKIVRRLLPSLWSLDEKEKPKADEVDVAWAVIP
jgi:hypothetical protein